MNIQSRNFKKTLINILLGISVLVVAYLFRGQLSGLLILIQDQEAVSTRLRDYGALGPAILFLLLIAQVFIAIIPGHVLMVTGGYIYGLLGTVITITSTVFGSQIAFYIARRYGRSLVYRIASGRIIERWNSTARYQGTLFYFFSFVLPIFPSDLMCYVAGLSTISARRFFIANLLGRTCCAVFVTLIGIYGMQPPPQFWLLALIGMVVLFLGWIIFKKFSTVMNSVSCETYS